MQNDLQAMARCHRIGQDKDVTVYRLITDNTYEQNVFECSTRKQGTLSSACQWQYGVGCRSQRCSLQQVPLQ